MPYIPREERDRFGYATTLASSSGQLNYQISTLVNDTLDSWGRTYDNYNTILGVLEAVKLELYRRHVGPYEDKKLEENGDI